MNITTISVQTMQKLLSAIAIFAVVFSPLANIPLAFADSIKYEYRAEVQVKICHANANDFSEGKQEVDAESILKDNGHDAHNDKGLENKGDIISSFAYEYRVKEDNVWSDWTPDVYPGKNLDTNYSGGFKGSDILSNDCDLPEIKGSISGAKYNDEGNDGSIAGDSKIPGWTIRLYEVDGDWTLVDSDVTDGDGNYEFSDVPEGSYKVCEVMQNDWTQTFVTAGTDNLSPNASEEGPKCQTVNIDTKDETNTKNFGNYLERCDDETAINNGQEGECVYPQEKSTNIEAYKIVCTDESEVPNKSDWASLEPIDANTAQDWVDSHDSCEFADGWEFEWVLNSKKTDPGDTLVGPAGGSWNTFGPTDTNGKTTVNISETSLGGENYIWLREVLKDGYLGFSHEAAPDNTNDVSAAFFCNNDVLNYDNLEWINNIQLDTTYQCVAWNVPPATPGCTDQDAYNYNREATEDDGSCEYYGAYCGDGELNQEWEQCEIGDLGCTEQCQWEEQNQCTDLTLGKIDIELVENTGNGDMTDMLYIGGNTPIPDGVWFLLHWNDTYVVDPAVTGYEDVPGLAVKRNEGLIRPIIHGSKTSKDEEHVHGTVSIWSWDDSVVVESVESDNGNGLGKSNKLEGNYTDGSGIGKTDASDDEISVDDGVAKFWLTTTTADDGFFAYYGEPVVCNEDPWCSFAGTVVDYTPNEDAKQNDGDPVEAARRNITAVETVAPYINNAGKEENDWQVNPLDFFSLGINGFLVYEFSEKVAFDQAGPDIAVYEITGGSAAEQTDEKIIVEVSQNGTDWESLGTFTGDAEIDIAPAGLEYVKYVKLTDDSAGVQGNNGDGYDVDAIVILDGSCGDEPEDLCPNIEGTQTEVPEGYYVNNEGQCVPDINECRVVIVSGTDEDVDGNDDFTTVVETGDAPAKLLSFIHTGWTAVVDGAKWIWGTDPVADPVNDVTNTFVREFAWGGNTITSATLRVASDNGYEVDLNGTFSDSDPSEFNYKAGEEDDYNVTSEIVAGNNTLEFVVNNKPSSASPTSNPAGLMYRLEIVGTGENCDVPPEVEGCTDPDALNYDRNATVDDDSCQYPEKPVCEIGENLLTNGSFEEPVVEHKNLWDTFASVVGWTVEKVFDDTPGELEIHRGWSGNEAADGEQYVELDSDDPNHSSMRVSQDVVLEEGAKYELSWAFAPRQNIGAAENALRVLVDNVEVATNSAAGVGVLSQSDWILGAYTFVAENDSGVVAFEDNGMTENKLGTFLDNAALCKVAEPVRGCTDSKANNYNVDATIDDGSCTYDGGGGNDPEYLIFGFVWEDENENGIWDGNESEEEQEEQLIEQDPENPLQGWTVTITNGEDIFSTTTDAEGYYYFNVPAGTWTISETVQSNWSQTFPNPVTYTVTVPEDLTVSESENFFARVMSHIIPTAHAVVSKTSYGAYNFGNVYSPSIITTTSTSGGGSSSGGGGSSSPRCEAFELNGNELSWETRRGYELSITLFDTEIFSTDDDDVVDEGSITILPEVSGVYELTVSNGRRSDTCTVEVSGGEVLGAATSDLPVGAPNTGAGGTSHTLPALPSFVAILETGIRRMK